MSEKKPVRYRLIDKDGIAFGPYPSAQAAAEMAAQLWPGVEQRDHENGRDGWDIEVLKPE